MSGPAGWEEMDSDKRTYWGCFDEGGYSLEPRAIFEDHDEAAHWCSRPDRTGTMLVLPVRRLRGDAWNRMEPVPDEPGYVAEDI
jgi:hypothetical protein